jgi:hypothetical protein
MTSSAIFSRIYNRLTYFYKGFYRNDICQEDPAKVQYGKQWYSDKLIQALNLCTSWQGELVTAIKSIILDLEDIQYTPEQR